MTTTRTILTAAIAAASAAIAAANLMPEHGLVAAATGGAFVGIVAATVTYVVFSLGGRRG